MKTLKTRMFAIITAAAAFAATGCATSVTDAERDLPAHTMQSAVNHGAYESAPARMYLEHAEASLEKADKQIKDEDYDEARLTLAKADADAELALEYAQLRETQVKVLDLKQRIEEFEERVEESNSEVSQL